MIYLLKLERTQEVWGPLPSTEIVGVFDSMEKLEKAKAESTWNEIIINNPKDDWEWEIEEMEINQLNK